MAQQHHSMFGHVVTNGGNAVKGANIELISQENRKLIASGVTNEKGQYFLSWYGRPVDRYPPLAVRVTGQDDHFVSEQEISKLSGRFDLTVSKERLDNYRPAVKTLDRIKNPPMINSQKVFTGRGTLTMA